MNLNEKLEEPFAEINYCFSIFQSLAEKKLELSEEQIERLDNWFKVNEVNFVYVEEYENIAQVKEVLEKIRSKKRAYIELENHEIVAQLRDLEIQFEDKVLSIETYLERKVEIQTRYSSIGFSLLSLNKISDDVLKRFKDLGLEIKDYSKVLKQLKLI